MLGTIEEKLNRFGKKAVHQTKTFSEINSLKAQLTEQQRTLERYYQDLGKTYYEKNETNPALMSQTLFENISILRGNIEQYNRQIENLKGMRQCDVCGATVEKDARFCPECGGSLKVAKAPDISAGGVNTERPCDKAESFCPECGAKVLPDTKFCYECGFMIRK